MTALKHLHRLPAALLALTACLSVTIRAVENAPCYYPGGEPALGFYPCQAFNAPVSSCCPAGWTCFSNALCIATTNSNSFPNLTLGAVQRGACTNPQWNNNICGGACLDADNADGKLAACGDDRFCCANDFNSGKCNCAGPDGENRALTISAGLAQTIIQVSDVTFAGGAPSLSIASTRETDLPTTTTSVTTTRADSATASGTGTGTGTPASSGQSPSSVSASVTATATNGGGGSGGGGGGNKGRTIALAVGISVGVALILVLVLGYVFWWRPRHPASGGAGSSAAGGDGGGQPDTFGPSLELAEDHLNGPTFGRQYHGLPQQ